MTMGAVHQFDPDTAGQHDAHEWWPTWYRRAFDTYTSHDIVTDKALQRAGIDHRVHLSGGAVLLIDVKCRCTAKRWHEDVLVEAWSDAQRRIPGWARKPLRCHYLAYAWPQYEVGFLIPFHLLRLAYERNKHQWGAAGFYDRVNADNGTYTTKSFAVPVERLTGDVADAMTVYFSDEAEPF